MMFRKSIYNYVVLSQDELSLVSEKNMSGARPVFPKKCALSCNSHGGFTLLELLITLTLIGVIAVILTNALRLGIHAVSSGEQKIEQIERTRTSLQIIDSQIQSQIPLTFEEDAEKKYYFQGEREYVQFTTNYSLWGGRKGYVLVRYTVEADTTGKQFLSVSENIIGTGTTRESMLFSAVDTIYFEYYFRDPTEEEGEWVDTWTDTANIPGKIRVHLLYGQRDIPFVIPLRTAGTLSETSSTPAGRPSIPLGG